MHSPIIEPCFPTSFHYTSLFIQTVRHIAMHPQYWVLSTEYWPSYILPHCPHACASHMAIRRARTRHEAGYEVGWYGAWCRWPASTRRRWSRPPLARHAQPRSALPFDRQPYHARVDCDTQTQQALRWLFTRGPALRQQRRMDGWMGVRCSHARRAGPAGSPWFGPKCMVITQKLYMVTVLKLFARVFFSAVSDKGQQKSTFFTGGCLPTGSRNIISTSGLLKKTDSDNHVSTDGFL